MNVSDLIEQLKTFPSDARVELFTFNVPGVEDGIWSRHPVEVVDWDQNDDRVVHIIAED